MKEFFRANLTLVLAFALPILFIVAVALSTYLPSLFFTAKYDFMYAACVDEFGDPAYGCESAMRGKFKVVEGKLIINSDQTSSTGPTTKSAENPREIKDKLSLPEGYLNNFSVRLFIHDVEENSSREITESEATTYKLSGLLTSPDGITVGGDNNYGGSIIFPFGDSSYGGYYLKKGSYKSKLKLFYDTEYYSGNFRFIGWVLPDGENN